MISKMSNFLKMKKNNHLKEGGKAGILKNCTISKTQRILGRVDNVIKEIKTMQSNILSSLDERYKKTYNKNKK